MLHVIEYIFEFHLFKERHGKTNVFVWKIKLGAGAVFLFELLAVA
jgi:hypothetical protein